VFPSFFHYASRRSDPQPLPRGRVQDDGAPLTIRFAAIAEPEVERLAGLDGHPLPAGPHLVAEVDGSPVAALSLPTGTAVADPFRRSAGLVELLRVRAGQLEAAR